MAGGPPAAMPLPPDPATLPGRPGDATAGAAPATLALCSGVARPAFPAGGLGSLVQTEPLAPRTCESMPKIARDKYAWRRISRVAPGRPGRSSSSRPGKPGAAGRGQPRREENHAAFPRRAFAGLSAGGFRCSLRLGSAAAAPDC